MTVSHRRPTLGSMSTVELPEPVAQCLAAAAAKRGMTVDELAAETIAARFGDQNTSNTEAEALTAFIGSVDTGDPEWASTDTAVLRKAADTRRSA